MLYERQCQEYKTNWVKIFAKATSDKKKKKTLSKIYKEITMTKLPNPSAEIFKMNVSWTMKVFSVTYYI